MITKVIHLVKLHVEKNQMNNREKVLSLACVWLTMTAVGGNFGFGPGHLSEFRISDAEVGYVAGVSGLRWADFSQCAYAGEKNGTAPRSYLCFENASIVDGEKNAQVDSDDYWCPAITDMNLLIWSGWASKAGFTDEDALVDYFRATSRRSAASSRSTCRQTSWSRARRRSGRSRRRPASSST